MKSLKSIFSNSLTDIYKHFKNDMLIGYKCYCRLLKKYGLDSQIYKTAGGTGDVYVAGLYFNEYLRVNKLNRKPVFTVIRDGGRDVAELFGFENIELMPYEERRSLVHLAIFVGFENIHFTIIHHNPLSYRTSIANNLETLHGMCSLDLTRYIVYDGIKPIGKARFENDKDYIDSIFKDNNLQKGRTVVLSPYSVSMTEIPISFWERVVEVLQKNGFSVATNAHGEKGLPIGNTCKIDVPIKYLVPFLNQAGYFVGVRSGIVDVSESAKIKRILFYTEIKFGTRGTSGKNRSFYDYFSFNLWFRRDDAKEIIYLQKQENACLEFILNFFNEGE